MTDRQMDRQTDRGVHNIPIVFFKKRGDNYVPYFRQCESSFLGESRPYKFDSINWVPLLPCEFYNCCLLLYM